MSLEQLIMNIDNSEVVNELIQQGVNIHEENERALSTAVLFGETDTVRVLLENGANPNNADESLVKIARDEGHEEILELLLQYGAESAESIEEKEEEKQDIIPRIQNTQGNTQGKSRIQIAREIEEQNQRKREQALEEFKNSKKSSSESWVDKQCVNDTDVFSNEIKNERDSIVIFFFNNSEGKGECITESELQKMLFHESKVGLWEGPPADSNVDLRGFNTGKRKEGTSLYKLPWTGNWVTKDALEKGLNKIGEFVILKGSNQSIGSVGREISTLHGQWGGEWGYDIDEITGKKVVYRTKNFQPDERHMVYDV